MKVIEDLDFGEDDVTEAPHPKFGRIDGGLTASGGMCVCAFAVASQRRKGLPPTTTSAGSIRRRHGPEACQGELKALPSQCPYHGTKLPGSPVCILPG